MSEVKYPLASSTWDQKEIDSAVACITSGDTTMGRLVAELEEKFAEFNGSKYAVMVNSGSSANLLMLATLRSYDLLNKRNVNFEKNEIIVPTVSWSTTYYPISQLGYKIKFVDIDQDSLNISIDKVRAAINEKTYAILTVNLLGNPSALIVLSNLCKEFQIKLLEDNCESLGAELDGKKSGSFGLMGTFSTFFSHHINTMEGGFVLTDDYDLYLISRSLRAHGWVRDLPKKNKFYQFTDDRWIDSFRFILPGYNFRPLEVSAAIGLEQLKKLPQFIETRRNNANTFRQVLYEFRELFDLQVENGKSSWFGFALVLKNGNQNITRAKLVEHLSGHGIESRPIVAGNFSSNPVVNHLSIANSGEEEFLIAEKIDKYGLFIGNHHYRLDSEINFFAETLRTLL